MPTQIGVGLSVLAETDKATRAAIDQACARIRGKPTWAIVFAAHRHDLGNVLTMASERLPGAALVGCSTAGEITERGLTQGGLNVMIASSNDMSCAVNAATEISRDYTASSRELAKGLEQALTSARAEGRVGLTSILLGDALKGPFEKLVSEFQRQTRPHHKVVGGAAGDDGTFSHTPVGIPGKSGTDAAVALHLFGKSPFGIGLSHGFEPLTDKMMVTKSQGPVVAEVDGQPAFQAFVNYAKQRGFAPPSVDEPPIEFLKRIGGSLFGVYFFDNVVRVRGAHHVGPDGSVLVSGEIPVGSQICIIGADSHQLVGAARAAAEEARGNLKGKKAAGVLVFSCITRNLVLGDEYHREIEAIKAVFPDTPVAGLLSYGEIARYNGRLDGYHNATCVVAAIPAYDE